MTYKSVANGIFAGFFFTFIQMVGNIVLSGLIVRSLSLYESGIWFLCLSIITILNVCDFGLSSTLSREIGFASNKRSKILRYSNLYSTAMKIFLLLSGMVLLGLAGFYYYLQANANFNSRVVCGFMIFTVGVLFKFNANPSLALIYGDGRIAAQKTLQGIASIIGLMISITLLMLHYGFVGAMVGFASQAILLFLVSRIYISKCFAWLKNLHLHKLTMLRIMQPSLQWTITMLGGILIFQIDNFMVAALRGPEYVTDYSVIKQLAIFIIAISAMVGSAIVPFVSQAKGKVDFDGMRRLFESNVKLSTCLAIFCACFVMVFHQEIATLWLGKTYQFNYLVLILLMLTTVLEVHHVACAQVAMAAGYIRFARISLLAGIINCILSYIFIIQYGIVGAALAILVSQLLTNNWYAVVVALRAINYPVTHYFKQIVWRLLAYGVLCLCSMMLLAWCIETLPLLLQIMLSVIGSIIISLLGYYGLLMSQNDRAIIVNKVKN